MVDFLRDIPLDIWHEILMQAKGDEPVMLTGDRTGAVWASLLVCKAWRRVARSFPPLWANLSVEIPDNSDQSETFLRILKDTLELSSSHSLSLHIFSSAPNPSESVWHLLHDSQDRCVRIKINCVARSLLAAALPTWSALVSLEIEFLATPRLPRVETVDLTALPLKTYVERSRRHVGLLILLPLDQLQRVELYTRRLCMHAKFGFAPHLTSLRVQSDSQVLSPYTHQAMSEAIFPALQDVFLLNAETCLPLLRRIPLTDFTFHVPHPADLLLPQPRHMAYLVDIVTASRLSLKTLNVSGRIRWRDSNLRAAVGACPALHTLHIQLLCHTIFMSHNFQITGLIQLLWDDFLSWIADLEDNSVCPGLQKLVLHCEVCGDLLVPGEEQNFLTESRLLRVFKRMLRRVDGQRPGAHSEINVYADVGTLGSRQHRRWVRDGTGGQWELVTTRT